MSECAGPLCSSRLSSTCEAVQEHCEAFFWGRAATPTRGVTSPQLCLDDAPPIPPSGVVVGHFVELSEARHPTYPLTGLGSRIRDSNFHTASLLLTAKASCGVSQLSICGVIVGNFVELSEHDTPPFPSGLLSKRNPFRPIRRDFDGTKWYQVVLSDTKWYGAVLVVLSGTQWY